MEDSVPIPSSSCRGQIGLPPVIDNFGWMGQRADVLWMGVGCGVRWGMLFAHRFVLKAAC